MGRLVGAARVAAGFILAVALASCATGSNTSPLVSPGPNRAGKLTIDTDKLKTAIAADYTKVKELFSGQGATKGLSAVISDYVGTQTGTNGVLTSRINGDDRTAMPSIRLRGAAPRM